WLVMASECRLKVNPDQDRPWHRRCLQRQEALRMRGRWMLVHLLLKRPKTRDGHADEAPAAESKPDVIDVEMFEDPSIPCEQFPDEEMPPGYFEDEQPMDVEKEVVERPEPMGVDQMDVCLRYNRPAAPVPFRRLLVLWLTLQQEDRTGWASQ
ncbi:unnamed protein product, partial [Symbiodinium microadriaticum]